MVFTLQRSKGRKSMADFKQSRTRMARHAAVLVLAMPFLAHAVDLGAAAGGGIGAAAGAAIGNQVGGADGAVVGGALGGAVGAATTTSGSGRTGAVVGGAVGGATGAAVGQQVGGSTGAIIGAGAAGAVGAEVGRSVTQSKAPDAGRPGPILASGNPGVHSAHPGKGHKHKQRPPGRALGWDKNHGR
jgi:hypothetical protein